MKSTLQIVCRDFSCSESIDARVRARVEKLEAVFSDITSCRVVIESPHQHQQKGNVFRVGVDVTVPHGEIVVRNSGDNHAYEDLYVAIRDAFDTAERRLKALAERRHGNAKRHAASTRSEQA